MSRTALFKKYMCPNFSRMQQFLHFNSSLFDSQAKSTTEPVLIAYCTENMSCLNEDTYRTSCNSVSRRTPLLYTSFTLVLQLVKLQILASDNSMECFLGIKLLLSEQKRIIRDNVYRNNKLHVFIESELSLFDLLLTSLMVY